MRNGRIVDKEYDLDSLSQEPHSDPQIRAPGGEYGRYHQVFLIQISSSE